MIVSVRSTFAYVKRVWTAYEQHQGPLLSAAVAFYGMLSMVPLLSLGAAIMADVIGNSRAALDTLQEIIARAVPGNSELVFKTVTGLKRDSGLVGIIGLIGLVLSAGAVFGTLENTMNNMWGVKFARVWWKQKLLALGTTILTVFLMLSSFGITTVLSWIKNRSVPGLEVRVQDVPFIWQLVGGAVPLILSVTLFAMIFKVIPNCTVSWKSAFTGGVFAGTAWEIAKYLFAIYMGRFANYNKVYGSLGAVVSIMVWAYYSSAILLIGGEIVADQGKTEEVQESSSNAEHGDAA